MLYLEKIGPATVGLGRPFFYEVVCRNAGKNLLFGIRVEDELPEGAKLLKTDPPAVMANGTLHWDVGTLEPGAERRFKVEVIPAGEGAIQACATATFSAACCLATQVTRPRLAVALTGPEKIHTMEPAVFQVRVTNAGTAPASHVLIQDNLPAGLWHEKGRHLDVDLGTLEPGQAKMVPLPTVATQTGTQANEVLVTADDCVRETARAIVLVIEPALVLRQTGPLHRYLNREAQLTVEVSNPGSAPAHHVAVADVLPPGLDFLAAGEGGFYQAEARRIIWTIDRLDPGQKRNLTLRVVAKSTGELVNRAHAQADRGLEAKADLAIHVEGISALLLEVADLEDPIEVGAETTYEIRVVNQGTSPATGITIVANAPKGMEPKDASGPAAHHLQAAQVKFEPLAQLAPHATVVYHIRVLGKEDGDMRFKVALTSDQLRTPVRKEESTRVYSDR
jgi:hypothetical protein